MQSPLPVLMFLAVSAFDAADSVLLFETLPPWPSEDSAVLFALSSLWSLPLLSPFLLSRFSLISLASRAVLWLTSAYCQRSGSYILSLSISSELRMPPLDPLLTNRCTRVNIISIPGSHAVSIPVTFILPLSRLQCHSSRLKPSPVSSSLFSFIPHIQWLSHCC